MDAIVAVQANGNRRITGSNCGETYTTDFAWEATVYAEAAKIDGYVLDVATLKRLANEAHIRGAGQLGEQLANALAGEIHEKLVALRREAVVQVAFWPVNATDRRFFAVRTVGWPKSELIAHMAKALAARTGPGLVAVTGTEAPAADHRDGAIAITGAISTI